MQTFVLLFYKKGEKEREKREEEWGVEASPNPSKGGAFQLPALLLIGVFVPPCSCFHAPLFVGTSPLVREYEPPCSWVQAP